MANCEYFDASHRDEMLGEGEKHYREHVSAYRLSFAEIIVVVAAVVFLAGMAMAHRTMPPSPMTTGSISSDSSPRNGMLVRCTDDNHYLTDACEP
jgi:hypothetical protein